MVVDITCSNGLQAILGLAFSGCSSLKNIELGNSIETIYEAAFEGCINLETVIGYGST